MHGVYIFLNINPGQYQPWSVLPKEILLVSLQAAFLYSSDHFSCLFCEVHFLYLYIISQMQMDNCFALELGQLTRHSFFCFLNKKGVSGKRHRSLHLHYYI